MSSERSGSNLLRTLLGNHSRISAPTAPHFLNFLHRLIPFYGPLEEPENARTLFSDMLAIVNHPNYDWKLSLEFDQILDEYHPRIFLDFFDLFYREQALSRGKERFVCKENNLFDFAFQLRSYYPSAKFIYLVRDPRDYAASFMRVPLVFDLPYDAARNWAIEQQKVDVLINTFDLKPCTLRYEGLISHTRDVMSQLLEFIGEPIDDRCFEVNVGKNANLTWNVYWTNLNKPVIRDNTRKYLNQFDGKTINMIESITRDYMIKLGYELDTIADWQEAPFFRLRSFVSRKLARSRSRRQHPKTYQLLASRQELIDSIVARCMTRWRTRPEAK